MKLQRRLIIGIVLLAVLGISGFIVSRLFITHEVKNTPRADSIAPVVTLYIPNKALNDAKTGHTLNVSVDATDNKLVQRVEYLLDDNVVARSTEPPFKVSIDISNLSKGKHTLQALAYDFAGNVGKSKVFSFTIDEDNTAARVDQSSEDIITDSDNRAAPRAKTTSSSTGNQSSIDSPHEDNPGNNNPPSNPLVDPARAAGGWFIAPPAQICSSNAWNGGPSQAGASDIIVPAGDNTGFNFSQSNKTYWFAPGEHTLGTGQYSQITPGDNSAYIGAPGAILDGKNYNDYAFSGSASNVRIAYLEVRNFGRGLDNNNEGVINHNSGTGWTMEYLYAHNNDGAAVFIGTDNTVRYSCLKDNGQYGFSMFKDQVEGDSAIKNIVVDHNEITGNNQDDWETHESGCGCTGGGKFWDVKGARVTNNYVHHNLSVGLWADTNDIDFLFDSNWIEQNNGEGIWYEISYNTTISRNVLKRNNWTSGNHNTGSPAPAIYISESGGDSRLQSSTSGSNDLRIQHNLLEDNFSGISIFESSNRFCNSNGNTSKTYCTPFVTPNIIPSPYNYTYPNPINATHPCYTNVTSAPYIANCRWHSQNVQVSDNEFRFTESNVPCAGTFCGAQALFATGANNISWAPSAYNVQNVQNDVMFNNNNKFFNNTYIGDWRFAKGSGEIINWDTWKGTPYLQDSGSTISGQAVVANALNADSATLESSIGNWQDWFSTNPTQSTDTAHTGTHSLKISMTAGGSWGVELNNWPGFEVRTSGAKKLSFWAKQGTGAVANMRMRVTWYDANDQVITDPQNPVEVPLTLSSSWQQAVANVTAPVGANNVHVQLLSSSGGAGNSVYVDDIVVADDR